MIMAKKVRLKPTKEQEKQLWKTAGTARFVYNWALDKQIQHMKTTGKLNKINDGELRKEISRLKQTDEYRWLNEVSNNAAKQAVKDVCLALDRFHSERKKHGYKYRQSAMKSGKKLSFTDFEDFPRFKSKKRSKVSFYHDTDKLKVYSHEVKLEKTGKVKLAEEDRITTNTKYTNPRITHDGKYWYISVGIEVDSPDIDLTGEVVGIDVGIKDLAVCSNDMKFKNINKKKKTKKQTKKLRRLQRMVSRKYQKNKKGGKFVKTSNIVKLEKKIKLVNRKIANIRQNHIHHATAAIVKTKPSRVVMESLNIRGMMKNRHLCKAIGEQGMHNFKTIMRYKCEYYGIEFVEADKWYPSSRKCVVCGNIKKDLKLSDRTYRCPECGNVIDRDYQAALNLSNYEAT